MRIEKACNFDSKVVVLFVAALLPWMSYALQGDMGLSLWDEGYLWYGAQRVMDGEVPLRDFQSYDIGRYYWAASIMGLLGSKGILALRVSNAALQSLAMLVAIKLTIWGAARAGILERIMIACSFMLWMTPDFKIADFFASIILIFALAYMLDKPSAKRYFVCGAIVGVAAILGRNHGVYGIVGSFSAIVYLAWRSTGVQLSTALRYWGLGVFIGYLPILISLIIIPGFLDAMIDSIKALFEYGSTNITLPLPRFWWVRFDGPHWIESTSSFLTGLIFFIFPFAVIIFVGYIVFKKISDEAQSNLNPVFVSSALLTLPYAHYSFSRADLVHLALGIFPFLICVVTFPVIKYPSFRLTVIGLLFAVSTLTLLPSQPYYQVIRRGDAKIVTVIGESLQVTTQTASQLALLNYLCDQYTPSRLFLAAPFWPGAYAVMNRKSPTWEIYTAYPQTESFQMTEIARLKSANISFAIVTDTLLDGRKDLLYKETHSFIDRYIRQTFHPLPNIDASLKVRVFVSSEN